MGWRDFQAAPTLEFMESMELMTVEPPLIPLIPFIPITAISERRSVSALPASPSNWRPKAKAWLTDKGELRTQGVFDDPAGEIINLTADNLPLQAKLLRLHVGAYSGPQWRHRVEKWEERAAIMEFDGGMSWQEAELEAARLYRMEAFLEELRKPLARK